MPSAAPKHGTCTHAPKHEQVRETASERGYDRKWQRARAKYLRRHPLCVHCQRDGKLVAGNVVDHITAHRGDPALFWDTANWQTLCKRHHDVKTATTDRAARNGAARHG